MTDPAAINKAIHTKLFKDCWHVIDTNKFVSGGYYVCPKCGHYMDFDIDMDKINPDYYNNDADAMRAVVKLKSQYYFVLESDLDGSWTVTIEHLDEDSGGFRFWEAESDKLSQAIAEAIYQVIMEVMP